MNLSNRLLLACSIYLVVSCASQNKSEEVYKGLPANYVTLLKEHGGLEKWKSSAALEFDLVNPKDSSTEHHIIDLRSRKDLIVADSFKIGFDGKEVWVSPNKNAYKGKSARFYHNLFSYFLAVPYFLADQGVNYQEDSVMINGEKYASIKCTFSSGMGDADKDSYKMLIEPTTKKLYGLLYTVTYYSGEAHENYNFLKYEDWQESGGLQFPGKLIGYKYANDSLKEKRYEFQFATIMLTTQPPLETMFEMPSKAEVDSLIKK